MSGTLKVYCKEPRLHERPFSLEKALAEFKIENGGNK